MQLLQNLFMNKIKLYSLIISAWFVFITITHAQSTGRIIGTVVDAEMGEPLIGTNVLIEGTTLGAAADLEGKYLITSVPVGTYNLIFSSIGFAKQIVTGVVVEPGEVIKIEVALKVESFETDEVVITAKAAQNSEAGMLINRQKSAAMSDAISSEQISKAGASDAADAVKKIVGATVVGGKYVYIRGLGERYSSTHLNGAELPSSDPNKKAFQLDLVPTNLLDNIVTLKTFTPDKPGNFSGGIVDVGTKSFPSKFLLKVSSATSYNSQSSFNDDFLTYNGADGNFLGFDDGFRELPDILEENLSIPLSAEARFDTEKATKLDAFSKSFNSVLDFSRKTAPINQSYSISVGDQLITGENSSFGYLGSLTYSKNSSYYDDGKIQRYIVSDLDADNLNPQLLLNDQKGSSETNLGGLVTVNYKFSSYHQIGGNIFYSRSGISESRYQEGSWPQEFGLGDDAPAYYNRVLSYIDRDIKSYQLRGDHNFAWLFNTNVDWNVSFASTTQDEPDRRLVSSSTQYFDDGRVNHIITGSGFDDPSRYFRSLEDNTDTYNLNFAVPFGQWSGLTSKFKFGTTYQKIDRKFNERVFSYSVSNNLYNQLKGNINELFDPNNAGIIKVDTLNGGRLRYTFGNVIRDNSRSKNNYTGDQEVTAYYSMIELPLFQQLKFIGGFRYETTDILVKSLDPSFEEGKISTDDLLHSFNLIYNLTPEMNIRAAATKTLARPTFREIAPYATKEFVNDVELTGNPNLKRTLIDNYDLRWEWFIRPGEIFSVSLFYKYLKNPIELAFAEGATRSNPIVNYVNVDRAEIYGVEFEARFRLDLIDEMLSDFSIGGNLSFVNSEVDIAETELAQRLAIDPNSPKTRELQGQSPFILNLDLSYNNFNSGTTASLNYNTFGERLSRVSANVTPDVYEQPASQLDLILSQKLYGPLSLKFAVKNLLNSSYKEIYRFKGEEYIYQEYKYGLSYGIGLSVDI